MQIAHAGFFRKKKIKSRYKKLDKKNSTEEIRLKEFRLKELERIKEFGINMENNNASHIYAEIL